VFRIGLTGGIASGKSTVADLFAELGADVIDTDVIAREVVAPGKPALAAIVARFGEEILGRDGALDRARLRAIVFADAEQRRSLEAILHPRIRALALERAAASAGPYVVLVVPLLFETGFDAYVDRTVAVDCPESTQIERLMRRDQIGESEARAILAAQMVRADRRRAADDIIDNSGTFESTQRRVAELHATYLELARNCSRTEGRAE
jgi:dephospho-CoA kinase